MRGVGLRKVSLGASLTLLAALALVIPAGASAGLVRSLLGQVRSTLHHTVQGLSQGTGPSGENATPQGGVPPTYTPPQHGTNPHGQGTDAVVDITPENTAPLPYATDGGSEDVVVGRARGEQQGGKYHGHVTIASLKPLGIGIGEVGVDTNQGESASGPLDPLQQSVLNALCANSGSNVCLTLLQADSTTDKNGSSNIFRAVNLDVGGPGTIHADALNSHGDISDDGTCQTSHGDSRVAGASVVGINANVIDSSTDTTACNDGSKDQSSESSVIGLGGVGVPLPQPGCADGTPNTVFNVLNLVSTVCNADDTGGAQANKPNAVREGLSAFVLPIIGGGGLVKATTAAAEAQSVAPPKSPPPNCQNPPCGGGGGGNGGNGGGNGGGGNGGDDGEDDDGNGPGALGENHGANGPSANNAGNGSLPFTGADLLALALIGGAVMAAGLGLMALADRRRSAAHPS
jgi:hypothetical protein